MASVEQKAQVTITYVKEKNLTLSKEERALIVGILQDTWQQIAYDVLGAVAAEKNKNIDSVTIPRSDVIEVTLDADHPEMCIHSQPERDAYKKFKLLGYNARIKIAREAFPHTRYGT